MKTRTLALFLHREEAASILVSLTGRDTDTKWLPRSQIEIAPERVEAPATREQRLMLTRIMVVVPEWMARSKGLVPQADANQGRLF